MISIPEDDELREAVEFSRRMGNYLFLPFFIVFGFCTVFLLPISLSGWYAALRSRIFLLYSGLMLFGFVFWRASRKPRASLLLAESLILIVLDVAWAAWIIYAISPNPSPPIPWLDNISAVRWLRTAWGILWAMLVFVGVGGASIRCFQYRNLLRRNVNQQP
jgi:hypothetical protein